MKKTKMGFSYSYDIEKIQAYMDLSAKGKLKWLEQANQLCRKTIFGRRREIWEAFRTGRI